MAVEPLLRWPVSYSPNPTGQNNAHFVVIIPSYLRSRSVCWPRASQRTKTLGTGRFLTHPYPLSMYTHSSLCHPWHTPVSTLRICAVVPTPVAGLIPLKIVSKYALLLCSVWGEGLTLPDKMDRIEGENTREPPLGARH